MLKKLFLLTFIVLIYSAFDVNAAANCAVRATCAADETPIFSLYENTDSHVLNNYNGNFKVCCPNSYGVNGTFGTVNSCGIYNIGDFETSPIIKVYDTGVRPLDSHVSIPYSAGPGYTQNICLTLNPNKYGNVSCRFVQNTCDTNEFGVISLAEDSGQDSHVGPYAGYPNNICCNAIKCPPRFTWNPATQTCFPEFEICLLQIANDPISEPPPEPGYFCQDMWRNPISQSDPYWDDALTPAAPQDCFRVQNVEGCCLDTVIITNTGGIYERRTYGSYQPINIIRGDIGSIGL